jgi:hypothetical protein
VRVGLPSARLARLDETPVGEALDIHWTTDSASRVCCSAPPRGVVTLVVA